MADLKDEVKREKLPDTRRSVTHKAVIHSENKRIKFFFTVGFYPEEEVEGGGLKVEGKNRPGEVFLHMDESGSTLDGFADSWAIAISLCLQRGEPLAELVKKFSYQEFEPKGMTENPEIPFARSPVDYVVRWMARHCGKVEGEEGKVEGGGLKVEEKKEGENGNNKN